MALGRVKDTAKCKMDFSSIMKMYNVCFNNGALEVPNTTLNTHWLGLFSNLDIVASLRTALCGGSYTSMANVDLYFCTNLVYSLSTSSDVIVGQCCTCALIFEWWNVMHY